jgi:peptide chain release factor 3
MARSKEVLEEAFPGDVVGLFDTGNFKIGDTLTEGEDFFFTGIPTFSPEIFKEVVNKDPMKTKQLEKGLLQLTDEGVAQLFTQFGGNKKIIGCVGELQFEVIQYRLQNEYGAESVFDNCPFKIARWIRPKADREAQMTAALEALGRSYDVILAKDSEERYAILCSSEYVLNKAIERYPDLDFVRTAEIGSKF